MIKKHKILIIDDEINFGKSLRISLQKENFETTISQSSQEAFKFLKKEKFDLILLDIMLPEMDGFSICEKIRLEGNNIPILFLSARNDTLDKIKGLKLGGDDYITKPFHLDELLLRIKKQLEKNDLLLNSIEHVEKITFEGNSLDFSLNKFENFRKEEINFSEKEILLLKLFIQNKNKCIKREKIYELIWDYDVYPSSRTLDNMVLKFRKAFEKKPHHPIHFILQRGIGYKFIL